MHPHKQYEFHVHQRAEAGLGISVTFDWAIYKVIP